MIKEKELAIKFMHGQAAKVKEFCDIEFFTVEDVRAIIEMDNEKLKTAWGVMVFKIAHMRHDFFIGLSNDACIFCFYYYRDCDKCAYGVHHGKCPTQENPNSDYSKAISQLRNEGFGSFTVQFYRDLLKSIQEENDD
jgi:hypothetical protein